MAARRRCSLRAFSRACTVNGPVVCGVCCACGAAAGCADGAADGAICELLAWACSVGACAPRPRETVTASKRTERFNENIRIGIPPGNRETRQHHCKLSCGPFRIRTSLTPERPQENRLGPSSCAKTSRRAAAHGRNQQGESYLTAENRVWYPNPAVQLPICVNESAQDRP